MATKKSTTNTTTSPATRNSDIIVNKCKEPYDTWASKDGRYAGECFYVTRKALEEILATNDNEVIFVRSIEKV